MLIDALQVTALLVIEVNLEHVIIKMEEKFGRYLLILMFQTCLTFIILWNTQVDVVKNVHTFLFRKGIVHPKVFFFLSLRSFKK